MQRKGLNTPVRGTGGLFTTGTSRHAPVRFKGTIGPQGLLDARTQVWQPWPCSNTTSPVRWTILIVVTGECNPRLSGDTGRAVGNDGAVVSRHAILRPVAPDNNRHHRSRGIALTATHRSRRRRVVGAAERRCSLADGSIDAFNLIGPGSRRIERSRIVQRTSVVVGTTLAVGPPLRTPSATVGRCSSVLASIERYPTVCARWFTVTAFDSSAVNRRLVCGQALRARTAKLIGTARYIFAFNVDDHLERKLRPLEKPR
jgi:hypothetical protein